MSLTGFADYFDGREAAVRRVAYEVDEGAGKIAFEQPETDRVHWPFWQLRELRDQADSTRMILTSTEMPLSRLILTDDAAVAAVRSRAADLKRGLPVRGVGAVVGWSLAAVASVALIVFVLVPVMADQLARVLPPSGERALGEATLGQIQSALSDDFSDLVPICDAPAGVDAMERMLTRLGTDLDLPYEVNVTVLDHDMVNAFALPGGRVVFFRGMIDIATSPDQIAAVLAHEIGHVAARDPTRIALRSAGSLGVLGLLFGDFAGGAAVLFLVEQLIQADYTREAEAAADDFGIAMMRDAGVDPAALGDLFEVIQTRFGDATGIAAHFMSHPSLGDRIAKARAAGDTRDTAPVLSTAEWSDLKSVCDG